MALMQHCQGQLNAAESQIRVLENGELRDFEPAAKAGDA
jgi:exonuclease VII small subunit